MLTKVRKTMDEQVNFKEEIENFYKLQTEIMELKIIILSSTKDQITHKKNEQTLKKVI